MNHSICDIAVGMILGYALARGLSHLHEESPLSDGADSMAEDRARRGQGASRGGGESGAAPAGR